MRMFMPWDVSAALAVVVVVAVTFPGDYGATQRRADGVGVFWPFLCVRASVSVPAYLHYKDRFDLILTVTLASSETCHGGVSDNRFMSHCGDCYPTRGCCSTGLLLQLCLQGNGQCETELHHKMDVLFTDSWLVHGHRMYV